MERIPSKCKITYELPVQISLPIVAKSLSDIEGKLTILVNDRTVFDEDHILIAELVAALYLWLSDDPHSNDFVYRSMDYEEEYIFSVTSADGTSILSSPWMIANNCNECLVDRDAFISTSKECVYSLIHKIPDICNIIK